MQLIILKKSRTKKKFKKPNIEEKKALKELANKLQNIKQEMNQKIYKQLYIQLEKMWI